MQLHCYCILLVFSGFAENSFSLSPNFECSRFVFCVAVDTDEGLRSMKLRLPMPSRSIFSGDCKSVSLFMGVDSVCPVCLTPYALMAFHLYASHTRHGCRTGARGFELFQGLRADLCLLVASSKAAVWFGKKFQHLKLDLDYLQVLTEAQAMLVDAASAQCVRDNLAIVFAHFKNARSIQACLDVLQKKYVQSSLSPVSATKWVEVVRYLKGKHQGQVSEPLELQGMGNVEEVIPTELSPYPMHAVQTFGKIVMELASKLMAVSPNPECIMTKAQRDVILAGETR